jgi:hypothetical protein
VADQQSISSSAAGVFSPPHHQSTTTAIGAGLHLRLSALQFGARQNTTDVGPHVP